MPYHVVFRVCEKAAEANEEPRPHGLDERQTVALSFQSLLASLKAAAVEYRIHVVEGGLSGELRQMLDGEAEALYSLEDSGDVSSLAKSFELAASFPDGDWVYFCEGDLVHRVECMRYIDELLASPGDYLGPHDQADLYVHPCDAPDRYRRPDPFTGVGDDRYPIFCSRHGHWRECPSAAHSWLTRTDHFKKNFALFHESLLHHAHYGASDHYLGRTLFNRADVLCLSPIPGLASLWRGNALGPTLDWQKVCDQYKSLL